MTFRRSDMHHLDTFVWLNAVYLCRNNGNGSTGRLETLVVASLAAATVDNTWVGTRNRVILSSTLFIVCALRPHKMRIKPHQCAMCPFIFCSHRLHDANSANENMWKRQECVLLAFATGFGCCQAIRRVWTGCARCCDFIVCAKTIVGSVKMKIFHSNNPCVKAIQPHSNNNDVNYKEKNNRFEQIKHTFARWAEC